MKKKAKKREPARARARLAHPATPRCAWSRFSRCCGASWRPSSGARCAGGHSKSSWSRSSPTRCCPVSRPSRCSLGFWRAATRPTASPVPLELPIAEIATALMELACGARINWAPKRKGGGMMATATDRTRAMSLVEMLEASTSAGLAGNTDESRLERHWWTCTPPKIKAPVEPARRRGQR